MNSFIHKYNGDTFKFTLYNLGSFTNFQIELLADDNCYYKSREIIISKHVIQEIIKLLKTGSPLLEVSRFEFRDIDKSFLLFINGETTIIGLTYNLLAGKREEFVVKEINKRELLAYLESVYE